ncbi:hypothetical protein [Neisseria leonii]|uniref:hypothetical protein n=1 Tax=Neisseria leonii TaxID=2995413 RepID=UPI00237ADEBC|nr:hypothetical protein [Neisseria sp. 3986]MDD9326135.1 hypothetical protein [Neisseria sp. 3986]
MFKRPEELIMAALALLWVVFSYFAVSYLGAPAQTALLTAALTLIWATVFFLLWQRNLTRLIWPLFLGLLTACWWPVLDWFAVRGLVAPEAFGDTIIVQKPWYASWTFKLIAAAVVALSGYGFKWKQYKKHTID